MLPLLHWLMRSAEAEGGRGKGGGGSVRLEEGDEEDSWEADSAFQ